MYIHDTDSLQQVGGEVYVHKMYMGEMFSAMVTNLRLWLGLPNLDNGGIGGGRSHWDQWRAIGATGCIRSFGSCNMRPGHGCHPASRATSVDLQTAIHDRSSRCVALQAALLLRKGPPGIYFQPFPRQIPQLYSLGRVGGRRS